VKYLSYFAVVIILYAFVMVFFAISLAPNGWWDTESGLLQNPKIPEMNAAFKAIFGQGLWIIIGSLIAFLVGQIVDVTVFQKIKSWTGEKAVWLRATGSTLISQFIDSYIVLIVAFYIGADWDLSRVLAIGTVNYIYKFAMAILLTPVIYLVHYLIDNYLGEDLAEILKSEATK